MDRGAPILPLHPTPPGKLTWLVLLVLVWTLYGMTGRDAWQADEAQTLSWVLDWLRQGRLSLEAPLYVWIGGLVAALSGDAQDIQEGARWASALFTLAALGATALAARSLFGPGTGALAVLLLMGAFGLQLRVHALLPETAVLAGYALLLYGLAASREQGNSAWAIVAGCLVLFLNRGLLDLLAAALCALLPLLLPGGASRSYRQALAKAALLLAIMVLSWLAYLAGEGQLAAWWARQLQWLAAIGPSGKALSTAAWFAWPAWPLALWALWHEHRRLGRASTLHLPLAALLVTLLASHWPAYSHDGRVIPLVLPLTLLATYGVATLKRGAAQAFYWFGVACSVFFALGFWLYFAALEQGWPPFLSAHMDKLTPGYLPGSAAADIALAAAATLLWLVAVPFFPRAHARPALVWATGMTLSWVLLITLFKPWAEHSWGYRPVAEAAARHLPPHACVAIDAQGAARTMLDYHLAERLPNAGQACAWRLVVAGRDAAALPAHTLVWQGYRPRHREQVYRLYRRDEEGHVR